MLFDVEVSPGFTEFYQNNQVFNPTGSTCCLMEFYGIPAYGEPYSSLNFYVGFCPENKQLPKPEVTTSFDFDSPHQQHIFGFLYLPLECLEGFLHLIKTAGSIHVVIDDADPSANYIYFG